MKKGDELGILDIFTKVKCSYNVPISNQVARKSFT